jgi:hypothetical protein
MQWFRMHSPAASIPGAASGDISSGGDIAIPVEDAATSPWQRRLARYLRTVIDYVHLNSGRAGIVDGATSCLDYPWSSLGKGYAMAPGKRPSWLAATEGLDLAGCPDTVARRRRFIQRLDAFIREEGGDPDSGGVPLSKQFERAWFWGSEAFRERLRGSHRKTGGAQEPDYRSRREGPSRDHGIRRAGEIIAEASGHNGMDAAALRMDRREVWRRSSVAWAIARQTRVAHGWIAEMST